MPANTDTQALFNQKLFAAMKPSACFYNIGRGSTVDQSALLAALRQGRPAAAYLDVTQPEPLPPDDPLWDTPNCFVTPHSAGGHADESERIIAHFVGNLRRFERGERLHDRVI